MRIKSYGYSFDTWKQEKLTEYKSLAVMAERRYGVDSKQAVDAWEAYYDLLYNR